MGFGLTPLPLVTGHSRTRGCLIQGYPLIGRPGKIPKIQNKKANLNFGSRWCSNHGKFNSILNLVSANFGLQEVMEPKSEMNNTMSS